jgi:uncharacterized membrane-anchored protein YhcB (DUF1043 family)|tara:strand:- start:1868 stop:2041 length:174 start_codon:yes stop_codon:yes gene_type:complete
MNMANDFMNKEEIKKHFKKTADTENKIMQDYLKKTGKEFVKFSIGKHNFHIDKDKGE